MLSDEQVTIKVLDSIRKSDLVGGINLLAQHAQHDPKPDSHHVILMTYLLGELLGPFRDAVESYAPREKLAQLYDATYGSVDRLRDIREMLVSTYGFTSVDDLADRVLAEFKEDMPLGGAFRDVFCYIPSFLALVLDGYATNETVFRLIDQTVGLLNRWNSENPYGTPQGQLGSWGSHSMVLGLVRALSELGVSTSDVDVLDFGCGSGLVSWYMRQTRTLVGLDIDDGMMELARNVGGYNAIHAHNVCEEKVFGQFDLIVSIALFQYFGSDEYEKAFRCAYANLRPGGHLAFTAPACSENIGETVFNTGLHALSDSTVAAKAQAAGFTLLTSKFIRAVAGHRLHLLQKPA